MAQKIKRKKPGSTRGSRGYSEIVAGVHSPFITPPVRVGQVRNRRTLNTAQLKVRLPEALRRELERAAAKTGWSMNSEILERLLKSFRAFGPTPKIIATALLNNLDDDVVHEMVRIYMQDRGEEERGEMFREEEQINAGQAAEDDKKS